MQAMQKLYKRTIRLKVIVVPNLTIRFKGVNCTLIIIILFALLQQ